MVPDENVPTLGKPGTSLLPTMGKPGMSLMGNSSMPNYIKISAICILLTTYMCALVVALVIFIRYGPNATIPSPVVFVIGTGMGLALQMLGMHSGAQLQETQTNAQPHP